MAPVNVPAGMPPDAVQPRMFGVHVLIGLSLQVGVESAGVVLPGFKATFCVARGGVPGPVSDRPGPTIKSWVDAATDVTQGPRWLTLPTGLVTVGLVFPADAATKVPLPTASRNLRSLSLLLHGEVPPEIEKLMTSTPSAIALLMPAAISAPPQLLVAQTLYWWMAAHGATPDMETPSGRLGAGVTVLSMVLPATVLAVCTP